MDSLTIDENDLPFEEEVLRHPYSMISWRRYIEYKASRKNINPNDIYMLYERALQQMPHSYKLWNSYLRLRRTHMLTKPISDAGYNETNAAHEKALLFMHKMPRIWIEYCKFLFHQRLVTKTRVTFDESLRALPITQHYRVWPLYIKFGNFIDANSTTSHIYQRYIKIYPENVEDYIDFLLKHENYDQAASHIIQIINNNKFESKNNKSRFQFIYQLCELITQHPQQLNSMSTIPNIIRTTIDKFSDGNGQLWCMLANYYIQIGSFESARDIFEEAINKVMTVKDFGQIFDTYVQFEETIISSKVEELKKIEAVKSHTKSSKVDAEKFDLELRLERLEHLIDRRAILLSSVLLRQNPHNVNEWLKRANLFHDLELPTKVVETFEQAIVTVDYRYTVGNLSQLWIEYANFYSADIQQSRKIYERAITQNFRYIEDLVSIWCHYAEMEISSNHIDYAFRLLERATAVPSKKAKVKYFDHTETIHNRLFKSLRLWCFYCDLSENYSTFEATKNIYSQIMTMKIANPQLVLNFTNFLESHSYFEESFKEFERAIELFHWPNVYDIWNSYLIKFIHRYGSSKLERIRDLFEQVLSNCPKKFAKWFYLAYAQVEENYGLTKNAISIYERAIDNVEDSEKYQMFTIYINRCVELVGLTCTRPIFDKAIECLPNQSALKVGLRYIAMEVKLGEIDRSRSIYNYLAQMADPKVHADFWNSWQEFEVNYGNPETFREMRRIRRTMLSHFHTKINVSLIHNQEEDVDPMQAVEQLEANAIAAANERDKLKEKISFVKSTDHTNDTNNIAEEGDANEINLDDDDSLEKKQIPKEVFGGLVK